MNVARMGGKSSQGPLGRPQARTRQRGRQRKLEAGLSLGQATDRHRVFFIIVWWSETGGGLGGLGGSDLVNSNAKRR